MKRQKPIATLSVDLDNQWSYMKTHGDPGWETFPSYFDVAIPRILKFLEERNLKITLFIVGQDAALEKNQTALRSIADSGHEIGNHSFKHEAWLHLYSEQQFEDDLNQAEEQIYYATGHKTVGFRGPGYSLSQQSIKVLINRGYLYDASTLPTFIGPLARLYYFMTSKLSSKDKHERAKLFGTLQDGLRPIHPYKWVDESCGNLIEIPVTTMPIFRVPIHVSYILYISLYSPALAMLYFRIAIWMCKLTNISPSLLLHPLDFLGRDDIKELSFFPGMNMLSDQKSRIVNTVIKFYSSQFSVEPIGQFVREILQTQSLPVIKPRFGGDKITYLRKST